MGMSKKMEKRGSLSKRANMYRKICEKVFYVFKDLCKLSDSRQHNDKGGLFIRSILVSITFLCIANSVSGVVIFSEGFEGAWPGGWSVGDWDATNGYDYWGDNTARSSVGSWAGYCADESDVTGNYYDNYMHAYFQRNIDLSSYSGDNIKCTFDLWYKTESCCDHFYFKVSDDGGSAGSWVTKVTRSGDSGGWVPIEVDLSSYGGQSDIWVAFVFESDYSIGPGRYEGVWVDNIKISACTGSVSLSLSPNPAAPSSTVTASASGLSSCGSKTVYIKDYLICSCTSGGTGCSCTFTSPTAPGTYGYYACVDKNGDGDFLDSGESTNTNLNVQCSGSVSLSLSPNPAATSSTVTASASGLSSCSGMTPVYIKDYLGCASGAQIICSCTSGGTGCSCTFTSPTAPGTYGYYACVDKNGDGDFLDSGESTNTNLNVFAPPGSIQVTVKYPDSSGISPVGCLLYDSSGSFLDEVDSATNVVLFSDVPIGSYRVECYNQGYYIGKVENVVVVSSQTTYKIVTTHYKGNLHVYVKNSENTPFSGATVKIKNHGGDLLQTGVTDGSGRASFLVWPTTYPREHYVIYAEHGGNILYNFNSIAAWFPYWDLAAATESFDNNVGLFDEISTFTEYIINSDDGGSLISVFNDPEYPDRVSTRAHILQVAESNNILVVPSIKNDEPPSGVNPINIVHDILDDNPPGKRASHINNIVQAVVDNEYAGIDIDYENLGSDVNYKTKFTNFICALNTELDRRAPGKILIVTVQAKTNDNEHVWEDYSALADCSDKIRLMSYDEHGCWPPNHCNNPGPVASIDWVEDTITYAVSKISQRDKIILGIDLNYGYHWRLSGGTYDGGAIVYTEAMKLLNDNNAELMWDSTAKVPYFTYSSNGDHTVYFEDSFSIAYKLDLARHHNLGGISLFRLGNEDSRNWDKIGAYKSVGIVGNGMNLDVTPSGNTVITAIVRGEDCSNNVDDDGDGDTARIQIARIPAHHVKLQVAVL